MKRKLSRERDRDERTSGQAEPESTCHAPALQAEVVRETGSDFDAQQHRFPVEILAPQRNVETSEIPIWGLISLSGERSGDTPTLQAARIPRAVGGVWCEFMWVGVLWVLLGRLLRAP